VSQSNPWTAVCDLETANCKLETAHRKTGFSLVDQYLDPGAGEGLTKLQPAPVTVSAPAFVYSEIRSYQTIDSVEIRFWDHYLGQAVSIAGLHRSFRRPVAGSILQGNDGGQVFTYTSPEFDQVAYLTLSSPLGDAFVDRFILEPGDSIYLSIDLRRGDLLFGGNAAGKFEVQHRIQQANRRVDFLASPSFHLSSKQDPEERRSYFERLSPSLAGFQIKGIQFVTDGEGRSRWMEGQLASDPMADSGLALLEDYRPFLTDRLYALLRADVIGRQLFRRITLLKNLPLDDSGETARYFGAYFSDPSQWGVPDSTALLSAHFSDFLLEKESMESRLTGEPLFDLLGRDYPAPLRDLLMGKFLLGNYRRLPDYGKTVQTALGEVESPYIRESLLHLLTANKVGSPVKSLVTYDREGNRVTLDDFRGTTVLLAFWFPGCMPSRLMHERHLVKVREYFRDRQDFELLSVSTDPNYSYWKQYLLDHPSYRFGNVNLFLGGRYSDPFLHYYDIYSYPRLMLVGPGGELIKSVGMPADAAGLIELVDSVLPVISAENLPKATGSSISTNPKHGFQ
jgi:hypothetical protein